MTTKDKKFQTTQKMLNWQYKQLIGELQELQRHASDVTCPCRLSADLGENCLCKHSLGLFILAGETAAMDSANNDMLDQLAVEANDKHEKMKGFLCQKNDEPEFIDWSRQWRKKLEKLYYYSCSTKAKLKEDALAGLFEKTAPLIRISGNCKDAKCEFKVTHTKRTEAIANSIKAIPHSIDEVLRQIADKTLAVNNTTFAYGTTGLVRYVLKYRIVEGVDLVVSNDAFTFESNPKYPQELQPRKRERAAAELQVRSIAAGLLPDILLIDFRSTDRGAPIIGPDMVVESGNGRVMALVLASRDAPAKYAEYREALKRIAPVYSLDPDEADKMKIPILVRERLTKVNRKDFAQDCNAPVALEQSAIEKARTDAEKMTVAMLQSIRVDEGQSVEDAIRSPDNKQFVVSFLNKLPQNEQAKLIDAQGLLNSDGLRRIVLAIFVATFVGDIGLRLAETFFESTDPNVKNTLNGITGSLGILAQGEGLILSGARYADYSIGGDLAKAVTKFSSIKKTPGQTVSKYINQMQLPGVPRELTPFQERILVVLDEHSRSGKRIAGILSLYAQKVIDSAPPRQSSFMAGERYSKEELFESAVKSVVIELETEREEARRKAEAKREPAAAMSEITKLFEVARLRQQLRFMIDDTAPAPVTIPVIKSVSGQASISACPTQCQVILPSGKKYELFDFQKEGVAWLKGRSYALLADDMGLGKTPQAIWWGADRRPVLVVVPSALVLNWAREITEMWRPGDKVKVLDGKESFPAKLPDWCVMSYGMLDRYLPSLQQAGFEAIIIDEAHNVKNLSAQRTKNILNLVAPVFDPEHPFTGKLIPNRLAVTGTPILNRPIELFALMVFLGVKHHGDYKDYLNTYTESKIIKGRTVFTGAKNLSGLHSLIQPFTLRRLKKDVLKNLPPKTITPLFVPISNVEEYREAERNFLTWMREKKGDIAAIKAASAELIVKMNSLRQLAAEGKVLPVADWLKPCSNGQGKVIVFSSFKEPLDKLAELKGASVVYSGSMNKEDRQQSVDDFQHTQKYCYFMGTIGAAGVGITLTAANRVCFLDLPWTPGGKIQAEDRAHRIGQTQPVEIVNVLAKGTIDERMLQLLADKEFIISQAVDGKTKDEAISGSISGGLIESYLHSPNLNETCEQYEAELADPDVNAVDADSLEILQGLREETPDRLVQLFEKAIANPETRTLNKTFRFHNKALNQWSDITADSPAAALQFLAWNDADVDIRKMWKSSGKINEGGQVMSGWGNITVEKTNSSKFRSMADTLQNQIDERRNPAISQQNITARRARIAGSMAKDADSIEETQSALRGMADAIDAGTLPEVLSKVTTKAQVEQIRHGGYRTPYISKSDIHDLKAAATTQLQRDTIDIISIRAAQYEDWSIDLNYDEMLIIDKLIKDDIAKGGSRLKYVGTNFDDYKRLLTVGIDSKEKLAEAKAALKSYVSGPAPEVIAEKKKRELEASLIGQKIPGFFPTPRPLIDEMIYRAMLEPGMSILEPSAGKGDIADAIKEKCPDCDLTLVEYNYQLCEVLKAKGYLPSCGDFLEHTGQYDRIIMNPPFENFQDIDHVKHAFDLLKPGGRLVAIMSEAPFFRDDKKAVAFRNWCGEMGCDDMKNEPGAFTGAGVFRQTGVNTRIVVIDKPFEVVSPFTTKDDIYPERESFEVGDIVEYQGEQWEIGFVNNSVTGYAGTYRLQRGPAADDKQVNRIRPEDIKLIRKANKVPADAEALRMKLTHGTILVDLAGDKFIIDTIDTTKGQGADWVYRLRYLNSNEYRSVKLSSMPDFFKIVPETTPEPVYAGVPVQGRLFDMTGFILQRLFPCNLTKAEIEKVLNWRPLRDFIAWAVGTKKAVQLCSIGMVPGVYQATIKDVHEITDCAAEADKRAKAIPTARKVYSPADAVYEIVVPEEKENELTFASQEVNMMPAKREAAEQAAMFERLESTGYRHGDIGSYTGEGSSIAWKVLDFEYNELSKDHLLDDVANFLKIPSTNWKEVLAEFRKRYGDTQGIWLTRNKKGAKQYAEYGDLLSYDYEEKDIISDLGGDGFFVLKGKERIKASDYDTGRFVDGKWVYFTDKEMKERAAMRENIVKVTGQCQDNVKTCKFVVRKPKPGKKASYTELPAAVSSVEMTETAPVCSGEKAKKLERCILRVKKKGGSANPFAVCVKSVGCHAKPGLNEVPANVQEAINNPIEVKV
jgi:hypothetical protein